MLLCNLFLGLSIDAYVCCGRANIRMVDDVTDEVSIVPSDEVPGIQHRLFFSPPCFRLGLCLQIHSWVMTRKGDGSVTFWECGTGKEYNLLKRWGGSDDNVVEDEEEEEEEDGQEEEQDDDNQNFSAFYEEDVTLNHKQLKVVASFRDITFVFLDQGAPRKRGSYPFFGMSGTRLLERRDQGPSSEQDAGL